MVRSRVTPGTGPIQRAAIRLCLPELMLEHEEPMTRRRERGDGPRCCVCERPLASGEWVYATHIEGKWVHGGCLVVNSGRYWRVPSEP
jgi:hypothetical protein